MRQRDDPGRSPGKDDLRRSSTAVAAGILLSRLSGLAREVITARFLGLGAGAEAFRAALRVPNVLQNLLGEGVLSASFVPVYSQLLADGRRDDARRLAAAVVSLLFSIVSVVVALTMTFAEGVTRVLAWGFVPGTTRFELTVTLVRILAPGVGLLVLSAWCLAILNSHRRFFLSYVAPVLWNVAIVTAVAVAAITTTAETDLATAMAWGAVVGSGLQFFVQLPVVLRLGGGLGHIGLRSVSGLDDVVRRFGQVVAGRGGIQIASYLDLLAASLLAFGAVSALGYAQTLYLLPIALFGMSVAAAELPALSTIDATDADAVLARVDAGLRRVAFFVLPTTVAFVVLGDTVVGIVFSGGRFDADAVVQVGIVLAVYSLALPAATASRLLQSVLYGGGDARTPALLSLVRVGIALAIGVTIMLPLDAWQAGTQGIVRVDTAQLSIASAAARAGPENLHRIGAAGLAIGAVCGSWCELWLLRRHLRRRIGPMPLFGSHPARQLLAAGLLAVVAVAARIAFPQLVTERAWGLGALAGLGVVYLVTTWLLGVSEARQLLDIKRRSSR
ncbi:MAG: murein biosynthesis integral membrane protein MurJ [Nitriliruptoraceae bacterium]